MPSAFGSGPARGYAQPDVSPEGGRVAVRKGIGGEMDIWIYDLARDTSTRLTFDEANDAMPRWSPDGQRVVFNSQREGGVLNLFWKAADGTGTVGRLTTSPILSFPPPGRATGNGCCSTNSTQTPRLATNPIFPY